MPTPASRTTMNRHRARPSALQFLRDHPPMILGVIVLHLAALQALMSTRLQPLAFDLRPPMIVVNPPVAAPPQPAPRIEPKIEPKNVSGPEPAAAPAETSRRSPRATPPPPRSTMLPPLDRPAGTSVLPAAPAASGADASAPAIREPLLDPAATARAIADVARHPLLPGSSRAAPMNFGDTLARDLGSDERTTEEHRDNGVLRIRSGNHCVLVSPSRTADPFTQANAATPKLTTSCD